MGKTLKKVYLPSGLIAAMYNLYGGSGRLPEALNMYDIQLLCSYLEFYYNYTNTKNKEYVYRFYTLPHFYKANPNDKRELKVEGKEDKIKDKHTIKVIDEVSSDNGPLYTIHKELTEVKENRIESLIGGGNLKRELDSCFGNDSGHPMTPYELGVVLERLGKLQNKEKNIGGFRISELYKIKRRIKARPSWAIADSETEYVEVPMFNYGIQKELSTFFILNSEMAYGNLTTEQFLENDAELRGFLNDFFASNCHKLLEKDKLGQYGPETSTFVQCFKQAVAAYNKLGFCELNRKYMKQLEEAKANRVNYGAIQE